MNLNASLKGPLFGISISILAFVLALKLNEKYKSPLTNPLIVAGLMIIFVLELFKIDLAVYNEGGDIIKFFIGPATVSLAIPLYKNLDLIRERFLIIFLSILGGSLVGILLVIGLGKAFGLDIGLIKSLIPKSTTTAIGLSIAEDIGAVVELSALFILFTGVFGSLVAEPIYRLLGLEDKMARGLGLGTASHVVGTSKAMELGEEEGAFASVAISIAGIITVFLAPLMVSLLL